jgi:L-fucose isomerase-like protein
MIVSEFPVLVQSTDGQAPFANAVCPAISASWPLEATGKAMQARGIARPRLYL